MLISPHFVNAAPLQTVANESQEHAVAPPFPTRHAFRRPGANKLLSTNVDKS